MKLATALGLSLVLSLAACGPANNGTDGAPADGDASTLDAPSDGGSNDVLDVAAEGSNVCHTDLDCSDGVFCNGAERCMPSAMGASPRGCVAANPATPCSAGQTCSEPMSMCLSACATEPDADHDGHNATNCGGDDCDDADPHRYPGNTEVCALDTGTMMRVDPTHDEDCDGATFANATTGDGDHDGDGYVDHTCCNVDRSGMRTCGTDCEDLSPRTGMPASFMTTVQPQAIHPTQAETCNGVDDNCNDMVDESLPQATYRRDCDGDGFGDSMDTGMMGCIASEFDQCMGHPRVVMSGDCNDMSASTQPSAMEVCNGVDDNCNGMVDDGITGIGGSCATGMAGVCSMGTTRCMGGTMQCAPSAAATPEVCDGLDNDCDGTVDDGVQITCFRDADGDGFGTLSLTMQACACPAGWVTDSSDCYDSNMLVHPGQSMFFATSRGDGSFDYNCNSTEDREYPSASMCDPGCVFHGYATSSGPPPCGTTATVVLCRIGAMGCMSGSTMMPVRCR